MSQSDPADDLTSGRAPLCVVCGQAHSSEENHCYTYTDDVDDDLICHICLQALLDPVDTPCGHTYCTVCLTNFLVEKDFCPVDRQPLVLQRCKKSSILVNKLLNKLLVTCPFTEHCSEVLQRCDLQQHFQTRWSNPNQRTEGLAGAQFQASVLTQPIRERLPAHLLRASDVNVPAASREPVGILREGQAPFLGISLPALSLSPLANLGAGLGWALQLTERRCQEESSSLLGKMKALLLLVLPWLSPANYIDNVGNLHFLYSELTIPNLPSAAFPGRYTHRGMKGPAHLPSTVESRRSSLLFSASSCQSVGPRSSGILMTPPIYARVQHRCAHLRMPTLECSQHRRCGVGFFPLESGAQETEMSDSNVAVEERGLPDAAKSSRVMRQPFPLFVMLESSGAVIGMNLVKEGLCGVLTRMQSPYSVFTSTPTGLGT
ncbi:E3 ubiquitin-protein ligase LNX [Galemys pyrenaicus]|uniref:E3 ubiquitin-protein ligase LNX n=1 Tax=Galemys pyrenaicus TaxID=202257 RepID=A0A8J6A465_GALPY|nr:E3 ubiquitin-protein ligase LNX [Galemys pyrenaicus]